MTTTRLSVGLTEVELGGQACVARLLLLPQSRRAIGPARRAAIRPGLGAAPAAACVLLPERPRRTGLASAMMRSNQEAGEGIAALRRLLEPLLPLAGLFVCREGVLLLHAVPRPDPGSAGD